VVAIGQVLRNMIAQQEKLGTYIGIMVGKKKRPRMTRILMLLLSDHFSILLLVFVSPIYQL
jgi:hypothetical protein